MNRLTRLTCHFAQKGFPYASGDRCRPCGVVYHRACIRVGWPFTCRRRDHRGLRFPKANYWPLFICECCTVRSVVGRELVPGAGDGSLLRLERMRMLDLANSWATNTYSSYNGKLRFLSSFEGLHPGVALLPRPDVLYPPRHPSIPLAWAEESFTLRQGGGPTGGNVSFGTTRQLRSAAGWSHAVAILVGQPGTYTMDERQRNKLYRQDVGINHDATLSQFTKGLKGRVGTDAVPSWVLRDRHIRAFDRYFNENYLAAHLRTDRRQWALAGLANAVLWLAWLRSSKLFGLRWQDTLTGSTLQRARPMICPPMLGPCCSVLARKLRRAGPARRTFPSPTPPNPDSRLGAGTNDAGASAAPPWPWRMTPL